MTEAGHSFAHFPQPTHLLQSTLAAMPRTTSIAPNGSDRFRDFITLGQPAGGQRSTAPLHAAMPPMFFTLV